MLAQLPRVLFAAASSGSGKTTVTSGILRCLDRRGANVHAYKCGPDYIDPMFHRSVLNTPCRNLDLYFSTEDQVRTLLAESALAGACAGNAVISVHARVLPFRVLLDEVAVVAYLGGE